jgi:hypothetical protein
MGKFDLKLNKKLENQWPRETGLVIGCSTFPTWNTVPGLFADLITGKHRYRKSRIQRQCFLLP